MEHVQWKIYCEWHRSTAPRDAVGSDRKDIRSKVYASLMEAHGRKLQGTQVANVHDADLEMH
jgi:hypothetical protein